MSDELGKRGESLFHSIITRYYGRKEPIFRASFLGDKWPLVDFLIELLDAGETTPYFFAQVKTTRRGYTRDGRLKIQLKANDMSALATYPAPTYIVGIDEILETGYILSANGEWLDGVSKSENKTLVQK